MQIKPETGVTFLQSSGLVCDCKCCQTDNSMNQLTLRMNDELLIIDELKRVSLRWFTKLLKL